MYYYLNRVLVSLYYPMLDQRYRAIKQSVESKVAMQILFQRALGVSSGTNADVAL